MKLTILILFFVIFLVGCTQANEQNIKENNLEGDEMTDKQYNDITSEELKSMLDSGEEIFLVDTHIPKQKHIKGTDAFIPFNEIENNLDKLPENKDAKIVLYCRSGSMSKTASDNLAKLGYSNIYNHLGGTIDWEKKGFEFEQN